LPDIEEKKMTNDAGLIQRRLGVIAVILKAPEKSFNDFNNLLHNFSDIIVGRMGIPYKERNISIVSIIVDGTNEEIGALSGKIGQLPQVSVKSVLTKF
jgi:putative iron-only hydrogenase system regulator